MKLSVIVPVYNVSSYLETCLDSILSQKGCDYEIILVDDGSTDNSGMICDQYAARHSCIQCIHKTNGGLSSARNAGLDAASGEYAVFIDSDDWIEENCFKEIAGVLEKETPEVLITTLTECFENSMIHRDAYFFKFLVKKLTKERAVQWQFVRSNNPWPAPKCIYSIAFLNKNALRFKVGVLHEDTEWTPRVFMFADCFSGFAKSWYCHRMRREGSITNTISAKNITDVIENARGYYDIYFPTSDKSCKLIFNAVMASVYAKINQIRKCRANEMISIVQCIEKNRVIFSVTPRLKYWVFVMAMNLLGIERALSLLRKHGA